ncbi:MULTISPECIES: ATP-binding protein [unclassified Lentimicrobium]|uniref:ATP-binding protein n=1 Tax=unclassified Lentimicrobium TaxID=2677434 RepID=UPI00155233FD|nr:MULTISPECIES: ATP-binding protein [unclassified Lentimicrobium]NPD46224.1 response regulator [Lentimicrobium sp. S6]NPD86274.1 response regulator [Lentimicrobium sp. L6]
MENNAFINSSVFNPWVLVLLFIILIIILISRYYTRISKRKISSLEEQLKKYSKENKEFKNQFEEIVRSKTKDVHQQLEIKDKAIIHRKIALKKANEANYLKNAFLASMSHEIRTPLSSIIGFSNMLLSELSLLEKPDLYEYAQGIASSSTKLLTLLDNLIDISRVDANNFDILLQDSNLNTSLENVFQIYRIKAQEKHLTMNFVPTKIPNSKFDKSVIEKIISLIIDNAIKYTKHGFINLSTLFKAKEELIIIRIKDTGVGIDDKFVPVLFDPFRQESLGYSKNQQGAGLGLPLVKKLLALIDGDITVKTKKGEGSVFSIYLPYLKAEQNTIATPQKTKQKKVNTPNLKLKRTPKILVVEDDKMNRLVFKKMLGDISELHICSDGDKAISYVQNHFDNKDHFDIVLMDINLPAPWDGIELSKELKSRHKGLQETPFIAQTAYAMAGDRERMLKSGFDDYISKPIERSELFHIIENNLNQKLS